MYVKVVEVFAATDNPVHIVVFPAAVPPLLTTCKVYPAGRTSEIATLVAFDGPLLVNTNVKVTVSPTFGEVVLTDFTSDKSAFGEGVSVSVDVLFVLSGSGVELVAVTVFTKSPVKLDGITTVTI